MDILGALNGVPGLLGTSTFWIPALAGLVLWYALAAGIAHLITGSGRDPIESAVLGSWVGVGIVVLGSVLWAVLMNSNTSLAIALGVFLLVIPVVFTFALNRGS
jgi:hypothetical protein